jgi:hypothetical protein
MIVIVGDFGVSARRDGGTERSRPVNGARPTRAG